MANKRQKKKKEKQQVMKQDDLVVNFINVVPETKKASVELAENNTTEETCVKVSVRTNNTKRESTSMKMNFCVQFMGKEYTEQEIVNQIKTDWKNEGNKIGDMKTLDIYMKVEEAKVYYVINGSVNKELAL
ncbi:MAG: DUF6465 family protein [Lachnospiraceae bacterium]|nr:DUF6465 family protein [Lachnospiraceae bacterium]MDD6618064.1 DUF6465 family protein [Clostridiales bacterium]MDY4771329.1 DUF6465 family protein [Lachnospiraceae bacterium]